MQWLNQNINHLTVPLGMLFALVAIAAASDTLRRRKAGRPPAAPSRGVWLGIIAAVMIACVLLGMAITHNLA